MRIALVVISASLLVCADARGQSPPIWPGDTVRIWASNPDLTGARRLVHALNEVAIELVGSGGTPPVISVAWTDVRRVDVQRGWRRRRSPVLWGTTAGIAATGLTGLTRNAGHHPLRGAMAFWAGFGIGAALSQVREPVWVTIPVPRP